MSRVLLTWELGLNWGHLMRLLPVAKRLRDEGHTVLVAARDIHAAASVLGPDRIPFVQAPHLPQGIPLPRRASGYADILLSQGWSDARALWGLTHGWMNLIRLFRPERMILDYSPTVMLAAKIAQVECLLIGNGYELPPASDPLPPFLGFSWATKEQASESERVAVKNANVVLQAFSSRAFRSLAELMFGFKRMLATFSTLDHYGKRTDTQYIGPLGTDLRLPSIEWPDADGPKLFALVRPDTCHVTEILTALAVMPCPVVCIAPGFTSHQLTAYARPNVRFSLEPVNLTSLLDANLCLTYGAEGTVMRFLVAGVPQLISPWHVEAFMSARKIRAESLGHFLMQKPTTSELVKLLEQTLSDVALREATKRFAHYAASRHSNACAVAAVSEWVRPSRCTAGGPSISVDTTKANECLVTSESATNFVAA